MNPISSDIFGRLTWLTNKIKHIFGRLTALEAEIGTGGVTKIIAGSNIIISPTEGTGDITINAAGGTYSPAYKSYTALLYQAGTAAPSATVLQNTLGGTITWTRADVGTYVGTLTGATFTNNKTVAFMQVVSTLGDTWGIQYIVSRGGDTIIYVLTQKGDSLSTKQDSYLNLTPIEIRVYY